jgi:hypothetical protein
MKTLLIALLFPFALLAQTRDSLYTVDSTASATSVTITLTARQAANLYRGLGVNWRTEVQSIITARAGHYDRYATPEVQEIINRIKVSKIDSKEKAALVPKTETVQVVKRVAKLEGVK